MIGMMNSRDVVEVLALILLVISQQSCWANKLASNTNNKFTDQQQTTFNDLVANEQNQLDQSVNGGEQRQQQYSEANVINGNQDNLKQILLKDLDLNGYMLNKPPKEQWRWFQLRELLDTLSSTIPTPSPPQPPTPPAPIYRIGRGSFRAGNVPASAWDYTVSESISKPALLLRLSPAGNSNINNNNRQVNNNDFMGQSEQNKNKNFYTTTKKASGIDFGGKKPTGSTALLAFDRPGSWQSTAGSKGSLSSGHNRSMPHVGGGNEEVAITPMHLRSIGDNEWKRVENLSKWNNLRGMWGKRASLSNLVDLNQDHSVATPMSFNNQQQQQQIQEDQQVM